MERISKLLAETLLMVEPLGPVRGEVSPSDREEMQLGGKHQRQWRKEKAADSEL